MDSKRHHLLVNENQEIIPAYEILTKANHLTKTSKDYEIYIDILQKHNIPHAREYVEKMYMLDYIILNEDRHLGNFGIIRHVESLKWESVCPIYDTGRSMNTNVTENYWDFKTGGVLCFTPNFVFSEVLIELFTITLSRKQIDDLKALVLVYDSLLKENQSYIRLFDEQIIKLKNGLKERINLFERVMDEKGLIK